MAELPDMKPEQLTAAVDEFLAAYRKNPEFLTSPPFEFRIAERAISSTRCGWIRFADGRGGIPGECRAGAPLRRRPER